MPKFKDLYKTFVGVGSIFERFVMAQNNLQISRLYGLVRQEKH